MEGEGAAGAFADVEVRVELEQLGRWQLEADQQEVGELAELQLRRQLEGLGAARLQGGYEVGGMFVEPPQGARTTLNRLVSG